MQDDGEKEVGFIVFIGEDIHGLREKINDRSRREERSGRGSRLKITEFFFVKLQVIH